MRNQPPPTPDADAPIGAQLREEGMPPDEISAVLAASDADVVHRYLELHGERLAERLARQRLKLRVIEQVLVGRMHGKG